MELPPADPGVASRSSPTKIVKKARTGLEDCSETCVEDSSASPNERVPSFRDKVTGFWTDNSVGDEVIFSDDSDVEAE
ncbi:hypothetical protein LINPERPRIM_LOCUS114 [Linum perenne]